MRVFRKNTIYIFTDGSSLSNPRTGGIGIRFVYLDQNELEKRLDIDTFGYHGASNNQMELFACVDALRRLQKLNIEISFNRIIILSDSRYVVDHVDYAKYNWPQQNWLNKDGKPILNVEIWKDLIKAIQKLKCRIDFEWVKGHAKDDDNKAVDKLAKKAAKSALNKPLSVVTLRRKQTKEKTKLGSIQNKGQKISIRIITSEYLKEQKLIKYRYEVISEHSKYFGKVDFAYSELVLRDAHSFEVTLNKNQNNPRILKMIKEIIKPAA